MASTIQAIELARYRGFRDSQRPDLARLNLIYGENNAGKSAFVRVPALLAASRTPGRVGLELGDAVRKAGFREVQWRGSLPSEEDNDLILGVGLSNNTSWTWTFRWISSRSAAVLQRIRVTAPNGSEDIERADLASQDRYIGRQGPTAIDFDGLIPRAGASAFFDQHRDDLARVLDHVIWLEAKREAPAREGISLGAEGSFASTGRGTAALVAADPRLRDQVSSWFREHVRCRIGVETLGSDRQRLVLEPEGASFPVPFPDAGEGLQQVFPLIVALEHLRREGGLLCVEEPESHLHPRLERALAERIVDVLRSQPDASVLVETHSEVFLLAALSAAVDGLAGAVRTLWIEVGTDGAATIENVPLDANARPTTPRFEQAFETMGVMRRELIDARRAGNRRAD